MDVQDEASSSFLDYLDQYLSTPRSPERHGRTKKDGKRADFPVIPKRRRPANLAYRPPTPPRHYDRLATTPPSRDETFESLILKLNLNRRASAESPSTPTPRRPALRPARSSNRSVPRVFNDRFLPARRTPEASLQNFHANKDPKKLSPAERILRNNDASPDAFNPWQRRVTSPIPPIVPARPIRRVVSAGRPGSASTITTRIDSHQGPLTERQVSAGAVWTVGGLAPLSAGVTDGRGGLTGSGTNAPLYTTSFSSSRPRAEEEAEQHENRLATALELDRTQRVFDFTNRSLRRSISSPVLGNTALKKTVWAGTEWIMEVPKRKIKKPQEMRNLPAAPFKVLDAPSLRDDFYCSVLAYCRTLRTLAVGLGSMLYSWSEVDGVQLLNQSSLTNSWITSVAFSSNDGMKSILAFGRSDGSVTLLSLAEMPTHTQRFVELQPMPVACISWKPTITMRSTRHPIRPGGLVKTEDLLVGDEVGFVYYYAVEWPETWEIDHDPDHWDGCMTLLARIAVHQQQICGLSWALDGSVFATGGNDNLCCLFETSRILRPTPGQDSYIREIGIHSGHREDDFFSFHANVRFVLAGAEKHKWVHGAAVKAIAFCPWREGLIATGGGSNDKCIHFFHTVSGACLATISVSAQVTSLIWSTTRREIAATFGYAQPEHPYRIAVFSWPECKQVAAIPWEGEHRALYAIAYPGGPNDGRRGNGSRTAQEGCIVVAASDESVKFHEVWTAGQRATQGGEGLLGGSDILEGLEGIDKEGEVIR